MESVKRTIQQHCYTVVLNKAMSNHKRTDQDKDEILKIMEIADTYDFNDVICKCANYLSNFFDYFYDTILNELSSSHYEFGDKSTVRLMANMIRRHTRKIKKDTSANIDNEIIDIKRMALFLSSEKTLENI